MIQGLAEQGTSEKHSTGTVHLKLTKFVSTVNCNNKYPPIDDACFIAKTGLAPAPKRGQLYCLQHVIWQWLGRCQSYCGSVASRASVVWKHVLSANIHCEQCCAHLTAHHQNVPSDMRDDAHVWVWLFSACNDNPYIDRKSVSSIWLSVKSHERTVSQVNPYTAACVVSHLVISGMFFLQKYIWLTKLILILKAIIVQNQSVSHLQSTNRKTQQNESDFFFIEIVAHIRLCLVYFGRLRCS